MTNPKVKSIDLAWVVVKNFEQGVEFYRDVLGLEIKDYSPEWKWVEFEGYKGGARLGLCEACDMTPVGPGGNAVVSFSVDDIDAASLFFKQKGLELVGEKQVIPGHVAMQLGRDPSGNLIHIVQTLS